MANINRDYLIVLDVKSSVISEADELKYYITDEHSQNLFVNLVVRDIERINKYVEVHDPEKYELELHIVKPNNDIVRPHLQANLLSAQDAIYAFKLPKEATDYIGTYKCELRVTYQETDETTITTSNKFKYKVKRSIYNDLDSIQDAPQYPVVIQLFDKLSDINQYEEDRRANELARQVAEQQRQTRFDALDAAMVDGIQGMDDKVVEVENRITTKEQAVDKLIVDTKADINNYKVAKDQEIDDYKTAKDTEINTSIANQNNKIDEAITTQNNRIETVEASDNTQNTRLDTLEAKDIAHETSITNIEAKNVEQDNRLDSIEAVNVSQDNRLDAIEIKNQQQDDRLLDAEKVNKRQDMDLKCLFAESKNNMIDVTEEGNSIYLQNSTVGYTLIDEIQGNTLVNCNKESDKEIILNGNINTQGYSNVTLTEGVDGGLVDVALEGNTMVNVCDQKDPVAITKSYTVETGNHVALQGEYDGKCRPVITGNTLWIDNDTEDVLIAFDDTKNLRLQSSFEDNLVTQEMIDAGEELSENLGKYKVDYVVTGKNKLDITNYIKVEGYLTVINNSTQCIFKAWSGADAVCYIYPCLPNTTYTLSSTGDRRVMAEFDHYPVTEDISEVMYGGTITTSNSAKWLVLYVNSSCTDDDLHVQLEQGDTATSYEPYKEYKKTFYLNSPLSEGDTIEQQGNNVVHVHRYGFMNLYDSTKPTTIWHSDGVKNGINWFWSNTLNNGNLGSYITLNYNVFSDKIAYIRQGNAINIGFPEGVLSSNDDAGVKAWIQENNPNVVYRLRTPQYEVISQNDTILCDSYVNGHLDVDSVVPIEKVDFLHFEEELTYLYANTQYAVQFVSDAVSKVDITLGGAELLNQNVVVGTNKYTITTPSELIDNNLVLNGEGFNASNIVVTEATDRDFGYFEGMKSVGECEELEVVSSNSDGTLSNTQTLTHEPLRAVGNIKDKYVLIDGKWYIERNCAEVVLDGSDDEKYVMSNELDSTVRFTKDKDPSYRVPTNGICDKLISFSNIGSYNHDVENIRVENDSQLYIRINKSKLTDISSAGFKTWLQSNPLTIVTALKTPQYEPIEYNPFEVYSDITHISNNSTIPCNMTIKNTGYNCLLKPSTTYTISSNLGLNTVTTPTTLTEDCLRFMDTDTSTVTTMKNVTILEGDYTTGKPMPSHFSGIESCFEQEYDEEKGKYKVNIKVANEDKSQENNITFYIDEPLRGTGTAKDRVFIQGDKVVVERKCGVRAYQDGDFGTYLTDKVNTVYPLAEPTYEEVEYNDTKLFIESFKNSTLFYNSNVPVTSTVYYSYSVPIVDTVAQTASISDEQDGMIIDLATQVAVMEMMLM